MPADRSPAELLGNHKPALANDPNQHLHESVQLVDTVKRLAIL